MIEFKQDAVARVPVRLFDPAGNGVAGIVFSDVTLTVERADGTVSTIAVTEPDWVEVDTDAFVNTGKYTLLLPITATDVHGILTYAISAVGIRTYIGIIKIVSTEVVDIRRLQEGRWKIHTTGADANRLVLYDSDGTTVLQKWNLTNSAGLPATTNIFERVPTEVIP